MDMFTNNIQNSNNDSNNVQGMNIPEGYEQVSQEEFIKAILAEDNYDEITKALDTLMQKNKVMNDKRYPVITTGRVEHSVGNSNVVVKMIGDDSEPTERVGYTNQTPFVINQENYVKICKQTASDGVNSWIMGINNPLNNKTAFNFLEDCINYILILQNEITSLKNSIQEIANSFTQTEIKIGEITYKLATINASSLSYAQRNLSSLNNISEDANRTKENLEAINKP